MDEEEMMIVHLSHKEHPLMLVKHDDVDDDDDINEESKTIVCAFCNQIISYRSTVYCCNMCHYFMHKTCAELKPVIINNHPLHDQHALKLMMVGGDGSDYEKERESVICDFCTQDILNGSVAYGCYECDDFLMHKTCAQIEPPINHYLHPGHPLTINYGDWWDCDACGSRIDECKFIYACLVCAWYACTNCVAKVAAFEEEKIEHPKHNLALRLGIPVNFPCDACKTDDKDLLYQCTDCPFSIHKTCATLAPEIRLPHHHPHRLLLAHQLPKRFVIGFTYNCEFCEKKMIQSCYMYHCPRCRYFTHIKCALNALSHAFAGTSHVQTNDYDDVMHFPMTEALTQPLKLLPYVNKEASEDAGVLETTKINTWSYYFYYPLPKLVDGSNVQPKIDPILVCNMCIRPLSVPYYCYDEDGCRFFLHKYCAELPRTLYEHPFHPSHALDLSDFRRSDDDVYLCNNCLVFGNSFVYRCKDCEFYLDVNCAFLPTVIIHESHDHPLIIKYSKEGVGTCNACLSVTRFSTYYECVYFECTGYQLHSRCALKAPRTIAHRYCKGHPVPLRYPPIDHLADFYCDICESEIHPKHWMYYCDKCDNCFHISCVEHEDKYGNCDIEDTITHVPYHNHPLTFARRKKTPLYVCFHCNKDINGHLILECRTGTCPFTICTTCHLQAESQVTTDTSSEEGNTSSKEEDDKDRASIRA